MEGLHLLPDVLQSGDWMVKMDLKDASDHQSMPSTPPSFQWEGMFTCLPFGLFAAPSVFHHTTETSSVLPLPGGMSSDNIPGRSTDLTPGQGQTTTDDSTNLQAI